MDKIHKNVKDMAGQVFGLWTVLRRSGIKTPSKKARWVCRCQCGDEHTRDGAGLRYGESKGCRKCKHKRMETSTSAQTGLYYTMRRQAEIRNKEWQIPKDFFDSLIVKQEMICALSGLSIGFGSSRYDHQHGGTTASLDRIDSSLGYLKDNIQWVHKDVNRIKMNLPQERFLNLCSLVSVRSLSFGSVDIIPYGFTHRANLSSLRGGAKRRGIEWNISDDYLYSLLIHQGSKCNLTGLDIFLAKTAKVHNLSGSTLSLDRIDSTKGYIEGNVQWVHKDVNLMKMDLKLDHFLELCKLITLYNIK